MTSKAETHQERFNVEFSIEDSVEVLLPPSASEREIYAAAERAIKEDCRKSRGFPYDLQMGCWEGPY